MADAEAIKRVKNIIDGDFSRRFAVVSAPGKRFPTDKKVTDLLLECHGELLRKGSCKGGFSLVRSRFSGIVSNLGLTLDVNAILDATFERIEREKSEQFTASRGEYLCGIIAASYFKMPFVDAEHIIYFNDDGTLNADKTYKAVAASANEYGKAVIPGFYGADDSGRIRTFSRGGSDITGAVVARAVNASVYENWTDVSGVLACDPNIVDSPRTIAALSYGELRALTSMGADVLHGDSVFPVGKARIPIRVKNVFKPDDEGTTINRDGKIIPDGGAVVGVAGRKDFTIVQIEKPLIGSLSEVVGKALSVFKAENALVRQIRTGLDRLSFALEKIRATEGVLAKIIDGINREIQADDVTVIENVALVAAVTHKGLLTADASARLFKAVAAANIAPITFGTDEFGVVIGVENKDCERCIKAIYHEFF